jgi:hypothetical protein
MMAEEE